jgi:hypothetical protein
VNGVGSRRTLDENATTDYRAVGFGLSGPE